MKTIYLVKGHTGEYADHVEWTVCAFVNKERAETHCLLCNDTAKTIFKTIVKTYRYRKAFEDSNPPECDPSMQFDYTGTDYFVEGPIVIKDDE
jgi:hypothetical protein